MFPLPSAQRRWWFRHRIEGRSATHEPPLVVSLVGELDVPALAGAVCDVVRAVPGLRTLIVEDGDGEPRRFVLPAADATPDMPVIACRPDRLAAVVRPLVAERFDLCSE